MITLQVTPTVLRTQTHIWRPALSDALIPGLRTLAEETPIAITFDGSTHAVMMATPADLEDFAIGFALTEGIIRHKDEVSSLEIIERAEGIELQLWLMADRGAVVARRRRTMAGPTGCGLCGVESLAAASFPAKPVPPGAATFDPMDLMQAMSGLRTLQDLHLQTGATHAAALWSPMKGMIVVREDVGRHNALDKVVGAAARADMACHDAAIILTSRVSVELVQKTAAVGAPLIIAVSAPTALAIRTAERANITLLGLAREDGFQIFSHPQRIATGR